MLLAGCASSQPSVKPVPETSTAPVLSAAEVYAVCWPADAAPSQKVKLGFLKGQVLFEALEGASNETARCLREVAALWPYSPRPNELELAPPSRPASGWAILQYVSLLNANGTGIGIAEPGPLLTQCLKAGSLRPGLRFETRKQNVTIRSGAAASAPINDAERCAEAVLGATRWPNSRPWSLDLNAPSPFDASGNVSGYFFPEGVRPAIDPLAVRDAIGRLEPAVIGCWNDALNRRAGLSGSRTLRIRVEGGSVSAAAVVSNPGEGSATSSDYLLDQCLLTAVRSAKFSSEGDTLYSWVFAERAAP